MVIINIIAHLIIAGTFPEQNQELITAERNNDCDVMTLYFLGYWYKQDIVMKMNKVAMAVAFTAALGSMSVLADTTNGVIEFRGELVNTACGLALWFKPGDR